MNVLIADLDKTFISDIQRSWSLNDTELFTCSDQESLMPLVKNDNIDLAFIEVPFLTLENMDMVSYLKERNPGIEIFVLCDSKNWPGATGAINRGANSFLMKPISLEQLESTAQKIQSQQQTKNTHQLMESQVLDSLLGDTPEMRKILKTVYKIAPTTSTVLITGESGSGKEFLANVVHRYSKRAAEPFPRTSWKASSSAQRKAPIRVRPPTRRAFLKPQTAARFSWTKSASFPHRRRSSCSGSCRITKSAAWAKRKRVTWMSASSRRPTATSSRPCMRARSVTTSTTV